MLTTPHAITGAAIAVLIPNAIIALPISFVSHYLLDTIPHWQEVIHTYKPSKWTYVRLPFDLALSVILSLWAASLHPEIANLIYWSAVIGNLPDIILPLVNWFPAIEKSYLFKKYSNFESKIHKETKSILGVLTQLIVITLGVCIVSTTH